jgi:hypothetical protein
MKTIKNISFFIVIALFISFMASLLESDFLFKYLRENIIGLLITLLAINTATTGLIASKMQDLIVNYPDFDFSNSIKEMKLSLLEQIILIAISIVSLIIQSSCKITFEHKEFIFDTLLVGVLIYAINILWDTGKGVFVIIDEIQKMKK